MNSVTTKLNEFASKDGSQVQNGTYRTAEGALVTVESTGSRVFPFTLSMDQSGFSSFKQIPMSPEELWQLAKLFKRLARAATRLSS